MDFFFWDVEQLGQSTDVRIVLPQRILELMLLFEMYLRPFGAFGIGKNPTHIIFCFDHEDSEFGNDDVINLRGSLFRRNRHIFNQVINARIEP